MNQENCIDTISSPDRLTVARPIRAQGSMVLLGQVLDRAASRLLLWFERARQRRDLARLDDRMLRDIGVGRGAAWSESQKHFWQA
jgi:uncharacterized protein YjiS (DUF1127 family)